MPDAAAPAGATAFVLSEDAVAERVAASAPGANVVKAFNVCAAELWASDAREFDGRKLSVPICGDNSEAVQQVAALAKDLKLHPAPAGGLHRAKYLEATTVFAVGLWFGAEDPRGVFPPLDAAFAVED
jgi:8-hydroxy-5-deazaflavin:NADPH oxidoreductase